MDEIRAHNKIAPGGVIPGRLGPMRVLNQRPAWRWLGALCLCWASTGALARAGSTLQSPQAGPGAGLPNAQQRLLPQGLPAAGPGGAAPGQIAAPAPPDPQAVLRARLELELSREGVPTAETSPALALEQLLHLLERDAVLICALQARAYLSLDEQRPAPATTDKPSADTQSADTPPTPAAAPTDPKGSASNASPADGSATASPMPAGEPAAPAGPSPAAPLKLQETERALFDYLRGLSLARASEILAADAAPGGQATALPAMPPSGPGQEPPPPTPAELLRREAEAAFEQTRLNAGPGDLRLRALYNLGTVRLLAAERSFLALASEQLLAGQEPSGSPAPDLRAAFEAIAQDLRAARQPLLEHLTLDWRPRDLRANLEWIQRRLEEIQAAIDQLPPPEEQPEENKPEDAPPEKPPPDSEKNEEEDSEGEQQKQESGESGEPKDPQEPKDGQPPEPSEGDQEPKDPEQSEEQQPEPGEGQDQPPEPGEDQSQAEQEQPSGDESVEAPRLSPVEIQRLLDRLARYEAAREELMARQRAASRTPVERDW